MTSLQEHLAAAYVEPESEEDRSAWQIGSLGEADWAMRKLSADRRQIAELHALANEQIARIKEWLAGEVERIGRHADFFETHLQFWWARTLDDRLAESGTAVGEPGWEEAWEKLPAKSQALPGGGAVKARKQAAGWDVQDDQFVEWACANRPELIQTKYVPKKDDIKKAFANRVDTASGAVVDESGEKVPGLAVMPPTVKITVEVGE